MQPVGVEVAVVRQLASPDTDLQPVLAAVGGSGSMPSVAAAHWSCTLGVTRLVGPCWPAGH
jgi:hypothetical protein